jgi:hypothetical protein
LNALSGLCPRELRADDPRNHDDIAEYIRARLHSPSLKDILAGQEQSLEAIAAQLEQKADGNFLYVKVALDGVTIGAYSLAYLQGLPPELFGLYEAFLDRHFPPLSNPPLPAQKDYPNVWRLLEVLVAAHKPLEPSQLASAADLDESYELPELLRRLAVYLTRRNGEGYTVFHKSLTDWLTNRRHDRSHDQSHRYYVSPRSGHERLADYWLGQFEKSAEKGWQRCDGASTSRGQPSV